MPELSRFKLMAGKGLPWYSLMSDHGSPVADMPDHAGSINRHRNRGHGRKTGHKCERYQKGKDYLQRVTGPLVLCKPGQGTSKKAKAEQQGVNHRLRRARDDKQTG